MKRWHTTDREHSGRNFRFFEAENRVAVCGGMGPEAARRATEAVISLYQPRVVQSVGFAGALEGRLQAGEVLELRCVIDAADGSRVDTGSGSGVLVSFASVAGAGQKAKLAKSYGAQAVDMEAAAVAKGAEAHGLRFTAIKVISDEVDFPMPPMGRFVGKDGQFRTGSFAMYVTLRPWFWAGVIRLARNSAKASRNLCERLATNSGDPLSPSAPRESAAVTKDGDH